MKFKKINVIGDIMLDKWCEGKFEKKSAEAPIKVFELRNSKYSLGGVGNLSVNLKSLKIKHNLISEIGNDFSGKKILELLNKNKINFNISKVKKTTTVKERFYSKNKQMFRKDTNSIIKISKLNNQLIKKINKNSLVIISDYKKGMIDKNLIEKLNKKKCKIFVDPKNKPETFANSFLVKPNLEKFEEWCGKFSEKKAFKLLKKMNWHWLIISYNKNGIYVFNKYGEKNFYKVKNIKNPNVVGAGDILFSCILKSYLKGLDIFTCVELASYAATKCVSKKMIRKVSNSDFKKEIVFTNGVFDILHKGHIELLRFSKKLGKKLVLAINNDSSVKKIKGTSRPFNNLYKRINNIKKLKLVDQIITFKEKTPIKVISKLKPDVIVKGDDYSFLEVTGNKISNVILYRKKNNLSSTNLINKLNKL